MLRILHDTKVDFIRLWRGATVGVLAFIIPAVFLIAFSGFRYSMEFTGGTLVHVIFTESRDIADVRAALVAAGLDDAEPVTFGTDEEFIIRAREASVDGQAQPRGAENVASGIVTALQAQFGDGSFLIRRVEAVGPKVGGELRQEAVLALLIAFGLTLIYLSWRFEWRFAASSILATIHDIVATLAFMKYMNVEISVFVVGAILTVIGYSMNDKVVVFDRVRENLKLSRKENLYDILNRSVNETLPRTVMTGSTTLATLLALYIFGGEVIKPFALVLIFGILIGTFSSIFVASPLLLAIERRWPHKVGDRSGVGAPISREALRGGGTPRPRPQGGGTPKPRTHA
jgi:preprotein translocase subunit SecF